MLPMGWYEACVSLRMSGDEDVDDFRSGDDAGIVEMFLMSQYECFFFCRGYSNE